MHTIVLNKFPILSLKKTIYIFIAEVELTFSDAVIEQWLSNKMTFCIYDEWM